MLHVGSKAPSDRLVVLRAPAKVNLFLHVLARRRDGYHDLETLVAFAEISDTIRIGRSSDLKLFVEGPMSEHVPKGEKNIVLRAAHALRARFGISLGASIILDKNIPIAAGLGGGSSDAAATLSGLVKLWKIDASQEDLLILAATLGADVPACLLKRPSLVRGKGTEIRPLKEFMSVPVLLINPGEPLSTQEVFSRLILPSNVPVWREEIDFYRALNCCRNDLESVAISMVPDIKQILFELKRMAGCRLARLSGSGATCFAIFDSDDGVKKAAKYFSGSKNWWIMPTRLID